MSSPPRIDASIIIPTYNRASLLRDALASVRSLAIPPGWNVELLVIDNNSTDDTSTVIAQSAEESGPIPHRRIVETQQGLSHARNRGLAEATSDWAVFLDDDMLVDAKWLVCWNDALQQFSADIVTGPVEPMFESEIPRWCVPRLLESVTSSYSRRGDDTRLLAGAERHQIPGCNFAVRTAIAQRAGAFDTSFGRSKHGMLACEDSEFAMRVAKLGGAALYVPGCRIQHLVSAKKISRAGLLARWRGLGVSEKKTRELHFPALRPNTLRLRARSLRFRARSLRLALLGDPEAFRWRLEAERLDRSL